jgi:hypothetical protein
MSDCLNQSNKSYLTLPFCCVCSRNRTYGQTGVLNQLRTACLWSSLRFADTPKAVDIVTRQYVLVPFVTCSSCHTFFCSPLFFQLCGLYLIFGVLGWSLQYLYDIDVLTICVPSIGLSPYRLSPYHHTLYRPIAVPSIGISPYPLSAFHSPPNNVPHRRGILFLCAARFGFDCRLGQEISLFCKTPRPSPVPTKPPIQLVTGGSLTGSKATGHRTTPHIAEVKNEWSYTSTPYMPSCCGQGYLYLFYVTVNY